MSYQVAGPELVLPDVAETLVDIYQALDEGTVVARDLFDREGGEPSPWVFAGITRWVTSRRLTDLGYEMENLSNDGLLTRVAGCQLRIKKADDGDPPVPGRSSRMQAFYHQMALPLDGDVVRHPNLLLLWDAEELTLVPNLLLLAPKSGDISRQSVDWHWRQTISDRGRTTSFGSLVPERAAIPDLDIRPQRAPKTARRDGG